MPETQAQFPIKLQFLFQPRRYKVAYGGRGGGKSWAYARALLALGMDRSLRVLCARELQNSLAESVHKLLGDQIEKMGLSAFYTVEKARIYSKINGTEFFFEGIRNNVDKIKSYEGIDICWVEEAQRVTKNSWDILTPTIRKPESEIWVSFNPDLESDETYQRFVKSPYPDSMAICTRVNYHDNPWFDESPGMRMEMEECRKKSYDEYLHIWEGHCKVLLDGAVYAQELRDLVSDGRLCNVPYDSTRAVDTFWDLGWADSTAVWFAQAIGFEYHVIDYYENSMKKLDHYLEILQNKPFIYDTHWLPHDAKAKQLGTGRSIQELMVAKGKRVRIVPRLSLKDGINAVRTVFPNIWIDAEQCESGVKALRHYRYELVEEQEGRFGKEPIHDWSSHGADAFRMLAVSLRQPKRQAPETSVDELVERHRKKSKLAELVPLGGLGWLR